MYVRLAVLYVDDKRSCSLLTPWYGCLFEKLIVGPQLLNKFPAVHCRVQQKAPATKLTELHS